VKVGLIFSDHAGEKEAGICLSRIQMKIS
jgi:hypothetical protein